MVTQHIYIFAQWSHERNYGQTKKKMNLFVCRVHCSHGRSVRANKRTDWLFLDTNLYSKKKYNFISIHLCILSFKMHSTYTVYRAACFFLSLSLYVIAVKWKWKLKVAISDLWIEKLQIGVTLCICCHLIISPSFEHPFYLHICVFMSLCLLWIYNTLVG